jgi:teichuronic acid biosynthesis glycosyltransferase TuaC
MRVLVLSSVFPNAKQPNRGVFVKERMARVGRHCELVVVAPIAWFPMNRLIRGSHRAGVPGVEQQVGLQVYHPRFFCIPRYLKCLDGVLYAVSLVPFLARLRREFPFDLIDAHFAYPDGMAAVLLGKLFRRPVTITLRGSIVRLVTYPLHRPQIRFALTAATQVLSVSESLKNVAVDLGIPPDKIRVIPNGVDTTAFFPRDRVAARRELGLPADKTVILSIGGLNEGKGYHRVVGVLPRLLQRHPNLLYVVVGGGRRGDDYPIVLEGQIARQKLQNHVMLVGEWPHASIPQWLAAADLFCLATRSEGWANVLLEALACGRPVVTTRVGGNPEIVSGDHLGILVDPGDDEALAGAILDALQRSWDAEAMVAYARAHSWDVAVHKVLEEFTRVVPGPMVSATTGRWPGIAEEGR